MGVPTSEVGYTPAMPKREDHEVRKGHWGGEEGIRSQKLYRLSRRARSKINAITFISSCALSIEIVQKTATEIQKFVQNE